TPEQVSPDPVAFSIDLIGYSSKFPQDSLSHGQGNLPLPREDPVRPSLAERGHLAQVRTAHQDADPGVQLPREPDDLFGVAQAGGTDEKSGRPLHPGGLQRVAV